MLEIRGLTKHFLGVPALKDVSFTVERGEIAGLIGPNGSGKTTLFDCVTGFLAPDRGAVFYREREITSTAPHAIARLGLARIFQQVRTFPRLTVIENLRAAGQQHQGLRLTSGFIPWKRIRDLDRALDTRALEILMPIENWPGVARAYAARATVYEKLGNDAEAAKDRQEQKEYESKVETEE